MDLTNLDITLSRVREIEYKINAIDRRFESLLGTDDDKKKVFNKVLDQKIENIDKKEDKKYQFDDDVDTKKVTSNLKDKNYNEISSLVEKYSRKNNINEELVKAVIQVESAYNEKAVSSAGAQGLMQLMPDTAKDLGVLNPFNPEENIAGGTKYLKNLINRYDSVELGLAAYNAGPGNVNKYGGIPPYQETQNYVKKVLNAQKTMTD